MNANSILYSFTIIMVIYAFSIWIVGVSSLFLPSPLVGMLILTSLLLKEKVKIDNIKSGSLLLLDYMGMFFIPPAISMIMYMDIIARELLGIVMTILLSTIAVMVVTGKIVQLLLERSK